LHPNHAVGLINNPKSTLGSSAGRQQENQGCGNETWGAELMHDYYYTAIC
jgi:hypothetical protein